jgi:hypothetical protein
MVGSPGSMGKRRHYTDDTAATCWLCSPDRSELCHVHDPAMRSFLPVKDGLVGGHGDEPINGAWIVPVEETSS